MEACTRLASMHRPVNPIMFFARALVHKATSPTMTSALLHAACESGIYTWSYCIYVSGSSCLDVRLPASCVAPKHLYAENLSFIFFAFTIGSSGMFDAFICLRCEREFVAVYPTRWCCKQCTMLSIHPLISKVAGRIGDVSLTFLLVPFVCFDYDRAARKRYLYLATH